jgi:hypothetical protein
MSLRKFEVPKNTVYFILWERQVQHKHFVWNLERSPDAASRLVCLCTHLTAVWPIHYSAVIDVIPPQPWVPVYLTVATVQQYRILLHFRRIICDRFHERLLIAEHAPETFISPLDDWRLI